MNTKKYGWRRLTALLIAFILLAGMSPVLAASPSETITPTSIVAVNGVHVYVLAADIIYETDVSGETRVPRVNLKEDGASTIDSSHAQLYFYDNLLWTVVTDIRSGLWYLRGYDLTDGTRARDLAINAWPEQGQFAGGYFAYLGQAPAAAGSALYALNLDTGAIGVIEERSILNFSATGQYFYYSPYDVFVNSEVGQNNSVKFMSEPPYPVYRFNMSSLQVESVDFAAPYPDIVAFGSYVIACDPFTEDGSVSYIAYDVTTGETVTFYTLTDGDIPRWFNNQNVLVLEIRNGGELRYQVFDAQLHDRGSLTIPADGYVPVAIEGNILFRASVDGAHIMFVTLPD